MGIRKNTENLWNCTDQTYLEQLNSEKQNQALVFDEAISEDLSDGDMKRLEEKIMAWLEKVSTG